MGKRKKSSRKPTGKKKNEPLPTTFQCLFCNHEKSVTVKMDKKQGIGLLNCKVCGQSYNSGINYLSAAVDVYSDWVDACDQVAVENAGGGGEPAAPSYRDTVLRKQAGADADADADDAEADGEMDDFIENDEMDAEAEYGS